MLKLADKQYFLQDIPLFELVHKYGAPLYIYDAEKMKAQYDRLCQAFASLHCQIKYACKALTNLSILKLFESWGAGLDTVSWEEVQLGLLAGFAPHKIIFTPNSISFEELQQAVAQRIVVNIDNLMILEQFGRFYGGSVPCCIRFNPNLLAGGNWHIQTGHSASKFGIPLDQLVKVVEIVKTHKIDVSGIHAHSGSDIGASDTFYEEAELLYKAAYQFPNLKFVDFGGGLKVAYHQDDKATDIERLADKLGEGFRRFCTIYGREVEIWFEPGKFLVSEAGYLLVKANVVKDNGNVTFVGVDSGLNHLIRPMLYNAYHKVINLSNTAGMPKIYDIVGYICETDTLAQDRILFEVRPGDLLCFFNAGAYGFSMSSNYNSRLRPAEVLILNHKDYLIRRRETLDDLIRNQVILDL